MIFGVGFDWSAISIQKNHIPHIFPACALILQAIELADSVTFLKMRAGAFPILATNECFALRPFSARLSLQHDVLRSSASPLSALAPT
jgi:hypothetical protein